MGAPGCRKTIIQRQVRVGIGGDVQYGKIIGDERISETEKRGGHCNELPPGCGSGGSNPRCLSTLCAENRYRRLNRGQKQCRYQCELSDPCEAKHDVSLFRTIAPPG